MFDVTQAATAWSSSSPHPKGRVLVIPGLVKKYDLKISLQAFFNDLRPESSRKIGYRKQTLSFELGQDQVSRPRLQSKGRRIGSWATLGSINQNTGRLDRSTGILVGWPERGQSASGWWSVPPTTFGIDHPSTPDVIKSSFSLSRKTINRGGDWSFRHRRDQPLFVWAKEWSFWSIDW